MWQRAVGNELGLSEASYNTALKRAKMVESKVAKMAPEDQSKSREAAWFRSIRRDVKGIFPALKIFQPGAPLHEPLVDVLMAYSMYRSDLGHVYGTHVSHPLSMLCQTCQVPGCSGRPPYTVDLSRWRASHTTRS